MGRCYCSGAWPPPRVEVLPVPTESPRRWEVLVRAFDLDGDIVCVGHVLNTSIPPIPEIGYAPPAEIGHHPYFVGGCSYSFGFGLPCSPDAATAAVFAWARDSKGLEGSAYRGVKVTANQPPQASPPYLRGETTVTLTPGGVVHGPVVMSIPRIWDPDGDAVYVHWGDLPPMYAQQIGLFLGSLVMMYWPDAADAHCRAVRDRDVIVDEFTVTLRDACGAET